MIQQRKKRNSSKLALAISVTAHVVLFLGVFYFAAREGILGKKLKQLAVIMVKEKPPEPPKPKPEEPKPEVPKPVQAAKPAVPPPVENAAAKAPPPAVNTGPAVAPPPVSIPSFDFSDGAKDVSTISDANGIYKALIEHSVKGHWSRPEDMNDDSYVAEVEFSINAKGDIMGSRWMSGSGNSRWDKSVQDAVAQVKSIGKSPPKGFPGTFVVRFDVEATPVDTIQVSTIQ
jgi:periplasmic protein TonB